MTTLVRTALASVAIVGLMAVAAGGASADMVKYKADLKATSEVPPTNSKGSGTAEVTYDTATKKLTWSATYTDLTGPATASHFHSPATATENAKPTVPLSGDLKSPLKGEATLTDELAKDLTDGKMYFNIHTAANPGGEIRGQVVKAQ